MADLCDAISFAVNRAVAKPADLAGAIEMAVKSALEVPKAPEWQEGMPDRDLFFASYKEQVFMLQPIFSLPKQVAFTTKAIDLAIGAIEKIQETLPMKGFRWCQQSKRMTIMHVMRFLNA